MGPVTGSEFAFLSWIDWRRSDGVKREAEGLRGKGTRVRELGAGGERRVGRSEG